MMSNEGKGAAKIKFLPLGSLQTSRENRKTTIYTTDLPLSSSCTDCSSLHTWRAVATAAATPAGRRAELQALCDAGRENRKLSSETLLDDQLNPHPGPSPTPAPSLPRRVSSWL